MRLRTKLLAGFGAVIALNVMFAAVTLHSTVSVQGDYELLTDDTIPAVHSLGDAELAGAQTTGAASELVQMLLQQHHDLTVHRMADAAAPNDINLATLVAALPSHEFERLKVEIRRRQEQLMQAMRVFSNNEQSAHGERALSLRGDGMTEHEDALDRRNQIFKRGMEIVAGSSRIVDLIDGNSDLHRVLDAQRSLIQADLLFFDPVKSTRDIETQSLRSAVHRRKP